MGTARPGVPFWGGAGRKKKPPQEHETFVRFVQTLRHNGEVAESLRKAGKLPQQVRAILFEQMTAKMRDAGEPEDLFEVAEWLREDAVFKKVLELMDAEGP